jgi:hypothetical protein
MYLIKAFIGLLIGALFILFCLGLGYAVAEFLTAPDPFYH